MTVRPAARKRRKVELYKKTQKKALLPPGTPVHIGDVQDFDPYVSIHVYCPETLHECLKIPGSSVDAELRKLNPESRTNWVDVEGIHDVNLIKQVSQFFDIHPLTQEDLVNSNLRPSFESYQGYYFFTLKMLYKHPETRVLQQEHVSIILKGNTVISFQEKPGDVFHVIRDRLAKGVGKVRSRGADYLTYMLLDAIVDGYYQVTDHIGEKIEMLEEDLRHGVRGDHIERIYELKREILFLRKNIIPVRDMINKIQVEGSVFAENSRIYITDLFDHVQQAVESIAIYTELANALLESYHSMQNLKMNQIFKVLTMISTVFLPLNFIAGIYGMNFEHMPELRMIGAYPAVLIAMALVALGMITWFIWAGWLFEGRRIQRRQAPVLTTSPTTPSLGIISTTHVAGLGTGAHGVSSDAAGTGTNGNGTKNQKPVINSTNGNHNSPSSDTSTITGASNAPNVATDTTNATSPDAGAASAANSKPQNGFIKSEPHKN